MNDNRFQRVQQLFLAGLEVEETERDGWLAEQCGDDDALLGEVRSLLQHDNPRDDLLEAGVSHVLDEAVRDRPTRERRDGLHIRCPHCRNAIELVDENTEFDEVECPSCGSSFSLVVEIDTVSHRPQKQRTIAHFELDQPLGTGAFGTVWRAQDTELDRTVAIKVPRKGQLNATETEQFFREARAAAQLRHPHIVPVHEVGREDDRVYMVSDYVDGITLTDWLTGQQPTPRAAAELCVKIADALHHAHEQGVIHRDLKPGNILLDRSNQPHLTDFGLAKREAGEITMTMDGQILGTPAYMSPEQAKGEGHHVDRRADVYSLGVILFELLTGERPFRGNTRMLLHQVIAEASEQETKRLLYRSDMREAMEAKEKHDVGRVRELLLRNVPAEGAADNREFVWHHLWQHIHPYELLLPHGSAIASMDLSADGRTLLTKSGDGICKIWDVDSGRQIGRLTLHPIASTSVRLSPSGKHLIYNGYTVSGCECWIGNLEKSSGRSVKERLLGTELCCDRVGALMDTQLPSHRVMELLSNSLTPVMAVKCNVGRNGLSGTWCSRPTDLD